MVRRTSSWSFESQYDKIVFDLVKFIKRFRELEESPSLIFDNWFYNTFENGVIKDSFNGDFLGFYQSLSHFDQMRVLHSFYIHQEGDNEFLKLEHSCDLYDRKYIQPVFSEILNSILHGFKNMAIERYSSEIVSNNVNEMSNSRMWCNYILSLQEIDQRYILMGMVKDLLFEFDCV